MKKLILTVFLVFSCLLLFTPNQAQTNDLDNLQKQITAIKASNNKLEVRLKQFMKTSTSLHDSLNASLNENNRMLKVLSDSLKAKESQMTALKADSEKAKTDIHSLKVSNTLQYIFIVLILIILIIVYFLLSKKVDKIKEQNENNLTKTKEGLEADLTKTTKELKSDITATKEDLQGKINDITKKLAAIGKQGKE